MKAITATAALLATLLTTSTVRSFSAPAAPKNTAPLIPGEVDLTSAFAASTFPIAPPDLIARAKQVLSPDIGIGTKDNGACLADDFEFVAAVVGPIGKQDYLNALGSFKLEESFDMIQQNTFGFTVDPLQPNRVLSISPISTSSSQSHQPDKC